MTKGKELAKNTLILFIGTFFTKIIQYFLLPLYTSYLSTSEYGIYELFNTSIYLLIPIIGLQVEHGVFRLLIDNRKNESNKKEIISSAFFFVCFVNVLWLIIFLMLSNYINSQYKFIFFISLVVNSFSSLMMQISRGLGDNKVYSFSNIVTSIFSIVFNIFFLVCLHFKAQGMMYGGIIGYSIGIVYLLFRLKLYMYLSLKSINRRILMKMLKYSLPMIPNTISWWIFSSSDRFIVSGFIGVSATGLLSVAYKFSNIIIVLYNIFNMSLTESISLHIRDDDVVDYFSRVFNTVGNLFISLGSILIAFMPMIFNMLINENYDGAYNLIPFAIIATNFQVLATMLGTIYVAKNNTKSVALTSILAALINIITDLLLINYIGIYAAVISTIVSYLILFIYRVFDIKRKYFSFNIDKRTFFNICINGLIISYIFYINTISSSIINILFAITFSLYFNKNSVMFIKKCLNKK